MSRLLGVWLGVLMLGCGQPAGESTARAWLDVPLRVAPSRAHLAAGGAHSLVLRPDGTVWAAGYNGSGALGDGTTTSRPVPLQVSGSSGVVAVSVGFIHSLALRSDGTVWAWGSNSFGQPGNGPPMIATTAVRSLLY